LTVHSNVATLEIHDNCLSWNLCTSCIQVPDGMLSWHSDYRTNVDNLSPEQALGLELDWYDV